MDVTRALLFPLCLAIAGCAAAYKPVIEGGPTARARVMSTHSIHGVQATVLQKGCLPTNNVAFEMGDGRLGYVNLKHPAIALMKAESTSIGMKGGPPAPAVYREVAIPAGKPFPVGFYGLGGGQQCFTGLTFTPEAGRDYEVIFSDSGMSVGGCAASVRRLVYQGESITYAPVPGAEPVPRC
jgi:hypothetical protein